MENIKIENIKMENKESLKTGIYNLLGRFDTVLYIFVLFTLPRLISKEGISFNFTDCFYTNGLFEKSKASFISAFLFELPIAVARWIGKTGMLPLLLVALVLAIIDIRKNKKCQK